MLQKLRFKFFLFLIKRQTRHYKAISKSVSLGSAQKVGLLTVLDSKEKLSRIIEIKKKLLAQGKKVDALGFVPLKRIPEFYDTQMQVEVISKKELSLTGIPKGSQVKNFIAGDFDLLIDLSMEDCLPLQYIVGITISKIKVGLYRRQMLHIYDFMIKKLDKMSYDDFIKSMFKYLSLLNTSSI